MDKKELQLLKFLKTNNLYPTLNEKIVKGTYFCHSSDEVIRLFSKLTTGCDFLLENEVLDVDYINQEYFIPTNKKKINSLPG